MFPGLNRCRSARLGPSGEIFVADTDNSRIMILDRISGDMRQLELVGSPGLAHAINQPYSVFVDDSGEVFVADYGNKAVKVRLE